MIWVFIAIIIIVLVSQFFLFRKFFRSLAGFELLLTKFIEFNQNFYEGQKGIVKKDKEIIETLMKQTSELSILRRYSTQINTSIRNLHEAEKNIKDNQKEIKDTVEELNVSKQIAISLASVSGNIKLLDKIVMDLKKSIEDLKRRK